MVWSHGDLRPVLKVSSCHIFTLARAQIIPATPDGALVQICL